MEVGFEPVGLSVKQNSPVDCFVARGGEIGTAAAGWGDEPRNFFEIAESHRLRQEKTTRLIAQVRKKWTIEKRRGCKKTAR